jgi:RNA polymerase sigma factor (sigma-70 family)
MRWEAAVGIERQPDAHEEDRLAPSSDSRADTDMDAERFAVLMHEQRQTVLRVAAALVGLADAEDATQEAIMRGLQARHTLRDVASLRPWLIRITYNVCHDWYRGRFGTHRSLTQPLFDETDEPLAILDDDPGASDATAALDLRQAINRLGMDLRVVVVLRYYAGMDATEVGAALGLAPATVRTRLRRALATLREHLTARGRFAPPIGIPDEQH